MVKKQRPRLIITGSGLNAPPAWLATRANATPWIVSSSPRARCRGGQHPVSTGLPAHYPARRCLVSQQPRNRPTRSCRRIGRRTGAYTASGRGNSRHLPIRRAGSGMAGKVRPWPPPPAVSRGTSDETQSSREFVIHGLPAVLAAHPGCSIGRGRRNAQTRPSVPGDGRHQALRAAARANGTQESLRILGRMSDTTWGWPIQQRRR